MELASLKTVKGRNDNGVLRVKKAGAESRRQLGIVTVTQHSPKRLNGHLSNPRIRVLRGYDEGEAVFSPPNRDAGPWE